MTNISIIGSGKMARALAKAMLKGNNPVQILGRDGAKTRALVESLGPGATGGVTGADITGAIVFLALPPKEVHNAILEIGDSLDGRVVVDISNPVDVSNFDRLTTERRFPPPWRTDKSADNIWTFSLPATRSRPKRRSVLWQPPRDSGRLTSGRSGVRANLKPSCWLSWVCRSALSINTLTGTLRSEFSRSQGVCKPLQRGCLSDTASRCSGTRTFQPSSRLMRTRRASDASGSPWVT